jgi:putative phosphotransacetylase
MMENKGKILVTANISNRHVHLKEADFVKLFGEGAKLNKLRELVQPGQFACAETVTVSTPKGRFDNVRIIGPIRKYSQVEISRTDSFALKLSPPPPVRESGELAGSSPITITGPKGQVSLAEGCILAQRHVHLAVKDAQQYGIRNGQFVEVLAGINTGKDVVFRKMLCRVGENMALECHLDTDEANACGLVNGDKVEVII